jgi:hypothetical protein
MPRVVSAVERASETVTIRLTREQKRLLERIAAATGSTATDVVRRHIFATASALGLAAAETATAATDRAPVRAARGAAARASVIAAPAEAQPGSFGDLAVRARASFAERGEGARRELDETIVILSELADANGDPLLPTDLPLAALTAERLLALRMALRTSGLRLSRKNLCLTYFRMMLNPALRQGELPAEANPGEALRPFTAIEFGESWAPPPADLK